MPLAFANSAPTRSYASLTTTATVLAFLVHRFAAAAVIDGGLEPLASCRDSVCHDSLSGQVWDDRAAASTVVAGPDDIDAYAMLQIDLNHRQEESRAKKNDNIQEHSDFGAASSGLNEEITLLGPEEGFPLGIPQGMPQGVHLAILQNSSQDRPCIDGSQVPEFFLLGVAKAATSSFSVELSSSPGIVKPWLIEGDGPLVKQYGPMALKEPHLFDPDGLGRFNKGEVFWEQHYPACQADEPRATVDCTPNYLQKPVVPGRILARYGTQAAKLKFMIMLREPLSEFQSLFYFLQSKFKILPNMTFRSYAAELLEGDIEDFNYTSQHGNYPGDIKGSMQKETLFSSMQYSAQIARYFKDFAASQFLVVPMQAYIDRTTDTNNDTAAGFVCKWLQVAPPAQYKKTPHVNGGEHPELEEDLDPASIVKLRALLDRYAGASLVAEVLAENQGAGGSPILFAYAGDASNATEIASWLSGNW